MKLLQGLCGRGKGIFQVPLFNLIYITCKLFIAEKITFENFLLIFFRFYTPSCFDPIAIGLHLSDLYRLGAVISIHYDPIHMIHIKLHRENCFVSVRFDLFC